MARKGLPQNDIRGRHMASNLPEVREDNSSRQGKNGTASHLAYVFVLGNLGGRPIRKYGFDRFSLRKLRTPGAARGEAFNPGFAIR